MARQLTLREKRFIDAYLGPANGVAKEAAIIAGYSAKSATGLACQVLARVEIQAEIARREKARPQSLQVWTSDYQTHVRAQIAEQWLDWMNDVGMDAGHRLKASDMLARHLGMYDVPKAGSIAANIDPAELSDAQLAAIAAGALVELDGRGKEAGVGASPNRPPQAIPARPARVVDASPPLYSADVIDAADNDESPPKTYEEKHIDI